LDLISGQDSVSNVEEHKIRAALCASVKRTKEMECTRSI
jgi:hypothetical protein